MALTLDFNIDQMYEGFFNEIAEHFPESFSAIPLVKKIEDAGFELHEVEDCDGCKYAPNELRRYVKSLLRWGYPKVGDTVGERFEEKISLRLKKENVAYTLDTTVEWKDKKFELVVSDPLNPFKDLSVYSPEEEHKEEKEQSSLITNC
jgi:hypothetical protein